MLRTVGKHSPNDTSSHTRKSESSCTFLLFSRIKTWNWFVFPFIKVVDVIFFQQSENGSVEAYKPYSFLRQWHFEMTAELATRVRSYYFYWLSCFSVTYTCVYAVATEHSYCCTRLLILLMSYCRISKFVNFEIRVFDICDRFFLYQCFDFSWLVSTNRYETTWPVSRFSPVSCYCAVHSQLIEVLYFRNLCWVLSCFAEWDTLSMI